MASMKGGFYNPPNSVGINHLIPTLEASMKGGFYNPPNAIWPAEPCRRRRGFNEGGVL